MNGRVGRMKAAPLTLVLMRVCACSSSRVSPISPAPEIASVIAVRPVAEVHPVLGVDDRIHLAYELLVVNSSSVLVNLDRVEALDTSGRKLDELAGDALARRVRIGGGENGTTSVPRIRALFRWMFPSPSPQFFLLRSGIAS